MDNQNDPNSPNNSNPTPSPFPSAPAASPWSTLPTSLPQTQSDPTPVSPEPIAPSNNPWPAFPSPVTPPAATPTPTFTPPQTTQPEAVTPSPLDNPWGAPSQVPAIDASQDTTQPSWSAAPSTPPAAPTESAPTDLSHLINSSQEASLSVPETLVVPSAVIPSPEISTMPTEQHKGMPKWLIGLGAGLLILVIGASAYFILGIGQPPKPTTSIPATTKTAETKPLQPAAPTNTASPTAEQSTATGAANFGDMQNSGAAPQATSAAELLRQRQQGR